MQKHVAVLALTVVLTILSAEARAEETSPLDQALQSSLSEISSKQIQMNINDDSHRQFRESDVEKDQRIEVDPNDGGLSVSSTQD